MSSPAFGILIFFSQFCALSLSGKSSIRSDAPQGVNDFNTKSMIGFDDVQLSLLSSVSFGFSDVGDCLNASGLPSSDGLRGEGVKRGSSVGLSMTRTSCCGSHTLSGI